MSLLDFSDITVEFNDLPASGLLCRQKHGVVFVVYMSFCEKAKKNRTINVIIKS